MAFFLYNSGCTQYFLAIFDMISYFDKLFANDNPKFGKTVIVMLQFWVNEEILCKKWDCLCIAEGLLNIYQIFFT